MSGANLPGRQIRKGAAEAIEDYIKQLGGTFPVSVQNSVEHNFSQRRNSTSCRRRRNMY